MVFDWPAMLKDGGLARARQFLDSHPDRCQEAPDQDALNAALEGKWTPLDPRWNLHETYLMFGGSLKPYVEHYTSVKPWSRRRRPAWRNAAAWYTRELAGTKWANFVAPQSLWTRCGGAAFEISLLLIYASSDKHAPFVLGLRRRTGQRSVPVGAKERKDVENMAQALLAEADNGASAVAARVVLKSSVTDQSTF
jgi:lipopolysaccharide biosynthesis glycosyltransferase